MSQPEVTIETPFPTMYAPRVWEWISTFRNRVLDDFGPTNLEEWMEFWYSRQDQTFAVVVDGQIGGIIAVQRLSPYVASVHTIVKRAFWGSSITDKAIGEVFAKVFADGFGKIYSLAFADNHQVLALMRRLGGDKEGHFRAHTMRNGKPTDMMGLGILKQDFETAREKWPGLPQH